MAKKIHCPWCSRKVKIKKKRLSNHVDYDGKKCIGTGMNADKIQKLLEMQSERREYGESITRRCPRRV